MHTFALLMPKTTRQQARAVQDRIYRLISETKYLETQVSIQAEIEQVAADGRFVAAAEESLLDKGEKRLRIGDVKDDREGFKL